MRMKKSVKQFALVLSLVMIVAMFSACSSSSNAPASSAPVAPETSAPSAPPPAAPETDIIQGEKMNLVVSSHLNPGSPENLGMQYMLDTLKEKTGGNITGTLYEGAALGGEIEADEQVAAGSINIASGQFATLDKYASKLQSFSAPYLYSTPDEVRTSWAGRIGQAIRSEFEKLGFYGDHLYFRGNRQMTCSKEIKTPADLKGIKLRLPETSSWLTVWESMGVMATPIASSEVFSALQLGVVDGQENSITSNYNKGLWEVQKYTILTNHIVDCGYWIWSKAWYDGLSDDYKDLLDQTLAEAADVVTKITSGNEPKLQKEMEDKGMQFIKVDTGPFADAAQAGIEKVAEDWEDWVYDQAKADVEGS